MKKLIFGFLAFVLFNGVSFANNKIQLFERGCITSVKAFEEESVLMYCNNWTITIDLGIVSASTNVVICCRPQLPLGVYCWMEAAPNPNPNIQAGYVEVDKLDSTIKTEIIKNNSTEIKVTKSSKAKIDNIDYSIKIGTHKIVKIDGVSYVQLVLEKA